MLVKLTIAYQKHNPGDIVNVADAQAQKMIAAGQANPVYGSGDGS